jgi:hypothetical protein
MIGRSEHCGRRSIKSLTGSQGGNASHGLESWTLAASDSERAGRPRWSPCRPYPLGVVKTSRICADLPVLQYTVTARARARAKEAILES